MGLGDLINLYRIQKLYKLIRELFEKPALVKDSKHWLEIFKTLLSIREVKEMLKGYKSYIIAILLAAAGVLHSLGYIDDATYQAILALLGAGAISTVAAKINRLQTDVDDRISLKK